MWVILADFRRLQNVAKECKREFNDIYRWLEVLVYSLKRSGA